MPPEEDRDTKRIDGLLASHGELTKSEAVLALRLDHHDAAIQNLRESQREAIAAMTSSLEKVAKTCEAHTARVERKIDEQSPRLSPAARASIIVAVILANGTIIAAVVGLLHP